MSDAKVTRGVRRGIGALTLVVGTLLLASCATSVTFDPLDRLGGSTSTEASATVTAELSASGAFFVVRLPASTPASGIRVRSDRATFTIPPGQYPPPGECRIWRAGVPPGQQSAPGPCGRLEREVPRDAYLIYG